MIQALTDPDDPASSLSPMPYVHARNACVAFWIRCGANELDGASFEGDDTFNPGHAAYAALGLSLLEGDYGLAKMNRVLPGMAVEWCAHVVVAISSLTCADPMGDHTQAAASIIAHYRGLVDAASQYL